MKTEYKRAGGTVTRESKRRWRVQSPDGREVGVFRTREQALSKAEHWDAGDVLASLECACGGLMPATTKLILDAIAGAEISEEHLHMATVADMTGVLLRYMAAFIASEAARSHTKEAIDEKESRAERGADRRAHTTTQEG